jgi:prepilin-type N-terminal cleavage/methylation domain-containing protein
MNKLTTPRQISRTGMNSNGFTIVELMIATAILSTILLLTTVLMINIGNLYSKGINQSRTQDDVRSITDQVSQDLKLNSGGVTYGSGTLTDGTPVAAYCISGNIRYTFVLNRKIGKATDTDTDGSSLMPHVLWRDDDTYNTGSGCIPVNLDDPALGTGTSDPLGTELINSNSRLTSFCIASQGSPNCTSAPTTPYTVSVGVVYGDIDLLNLAGLSTTCKSGAGNQFCAADNVTTSVVQRL